MTMNLFAQITKIDEAKRLVFGRAVQSVRDKSGERFRYSESKPYFENWSKEQFDASQGKSYGNIRAMHGKIAAGIVAQPLVFNDTDQAIDIATKITDDQEWSKCLDGTYTGFSIGGSYVGEKKAEKVEGEDTVWYTAKPAEISLVDSPCIPTARFFDIVKSDGAVAQVEFKQTGAPVESPAAESDPVVATGAPVPNAEKVTEKAAEPASAGAETKSDAEKPAPTTEPFVVKGTDDQVGQLAKAMKNADFAMGDVLEAVALLIKTREDAKKEPEAPKPPTTEEIGAAFAAMDDAAKSATMTELQKSLPADELGEAIKSALAVGTLRKRLDNPELSIIELAKIAEEQLNDDERKPLKTSDDVRKAIFEKAMTRAHLDKAQAIHDHATDMGASCSAGKATEQGDLAKLSGEVVALRDELKKLRDTPMPHVMLRVVSKEASNSPNGERPTDWAISVPYAEQHKFADGTIDWKATANDHDLFKKYGSAAA